MKTTHLLGLMLAAGAFGALAGGAAGAFSAPEPQGTDAVLLDRLSEIARGVDALRDAAADNRDAVADVRERVVYVEMEMERRAAQPAPIADPDSVGMAGPDSVGMAGPGGRKAMVIRGPDGISKELTAEMEAAMAARTAELAARLGDMEAAAHAAEGAQARFAKSMKIRQMPEDERWQYAAESLGLNSVQVDELRNAHETYRTSMKDAMVEKTMTTDSGGVMTFRTVDGEKMAKARGAFKERVDTVLNDEQKAAWKDEGFSSAMGVGRSSSRIRLRSRSATRDGSSGAVDVIGIEIDEEK